MSEDESVEAGRHTAQAFKALLSAALVVADAQRQRAVREMHRLESEARDRERDATQRGQVDATLHRWETVPASAGVGSGMSAGLEDPVELAQRWAAAQQPDTDPGERVGLDQQVRANGVDPDQVRAEHPDTDHGPGTADEEGRLSVVPAGRTADRVQREGVWQQGSPEVARAGLSYTRTPGATITPGLSPQRRPKTAGRQAARTRDLGR